MSLTIVSASGSIDNDVTVYRVDDQTWDETINTAGFNAQSLTNATNVTLSSISTSTYMCFNVTEQVKTDYDAGNSHATIRFEDTDYPCGDVEVVYDEEWGYGLNMGDVDFSDVKLDDRENTLSSGNTPYLNITYLKSDGLEKGLINITTGATPFYTNGTNPTNITLNKDECQKITWWINATGELNTHTFFVYANITSNMSISNRTSEIDITII